jgi:hypothetical protein
VTVIADDLMDCDDSEIASKFRTMMTEGQTFEKPNQFREKFYDIVIGRARILFEKVAGRATSPCPGFSNPGQDQFSGDKSHQIVNVGLNKPLPVVDLVRSC